MLRKILGLAALAAALAYGVPVGADSLDPGDDKPGDTRNELVHGSDQLHDLRPTLLSGAADIDWYRVSQKPYSSYEILVDTTSTSIGPTLTVDLVTANSDGTSVVTIKASSGVSGLNYTRSLRFTNGTATVLNSQYIRVKSGACTTNCTANDVYHIRAFNTSLPLARFDDTLTEDTYEFIQNPTDYLTSSRMFFFSNTGTLLCTTVPIVLSPKQLAIMDDDALIIHGTNVLPCQSGTLEGVAGHGIAVSDARYGDLRAKAGSVDVTTDWQFETDMPSRPY